MSQAPPPTTSLEALGAHIWHLQRSQSENSLLLSKMATHEDIKGIHATIATLATRSELDQKIGALRDELNRTKPATLGKQLIAWALGLTVVFAAGALVLRIAQAIDRIPPGVIDTK